MDGSSKAGGQTALRLPSDLLQQLQRAAEENHRTVSEEMRARLRASFGSTPSSSLDPWFADVVAAIGEVASGATGMLFEEEDRDTAVYRAFEKAVVDLLDVFRPTEATAITEEDISNGAALLCGMALARMGDVGRLASNRLRAKYRHQGESDAR